MKEMTSAKTRNPNRRKLSSNHMASSFRRMLQSTSFRSALAWLFITTITVYILYSSNLILFADEGHGCSTTNRLGASKKSRFQTEANISSLAEDENQQKAVQRTVVFPQRANAYDTKLKHIVFGIAASSNLWDKRKEYIKAWWKPRETRGVVWLDRHVTTRRNEGLPEIRISENTDDFKYTNPQGQRAALRISRVVSETLRLGMNDVRWFVMGDDDTVFVVDNVVRILSKYDHRQFYYVGSTSECHIQNIHFSYSMAYGGGGFAISYPLAVELSKLQDRCIQRYPGLYGSDDRIQACMAELGVPLTREPGFHQYDLHGDLLGLLGAHPVTPLVSIHHLDVVEPIFPEMTRAKALQHLMRSVKLDSASIMQQSICYDKNRYWSISVSWGFVIQIIRGIFSPKELEVPTRTFLNWYKKADFTSYVFNTRPSSQSQESGMPVENHLTGTDRYHYSLEKTRPSSLATGRLPYLSHEFSIWQVPVCCFIR